MSAPVWSRYVALGDSFSEGLCDPEPEPSEGYAGWADRLAGHLSAHAAASDAPFAYANLAVRGRKLADVVGPQLDAALDLGADLVSIVGGGNDLLLPRVSLDAVADGVEAAVVRARAAGADVLLATPSDPGTASYFRVLRARHGIHTANLMGIAHRHGAHVLNIWQIRALQDWRMWAEDRIHLTSEGHRRAALAALDGLGFATDREDWMTPLPPADPTPRREQVGNTLAWGKDHFAPWVQRRVRGTSTGDARPAKRPTLTPIDPVPFQSAGSPALRAVADPAQAAGAAAAR